jgi:hypothetical protein
VVLCVDHASDVLTELEARRAASAGVAGNGGGDGQAVVSIPEFEA